MLFRALVFVPVFRTRGVPFSIAVYQLDIELMYIAFVCAEPQESSLTNLAVSPEVWLLESGCGI